MADQQQPEVKIKFVKKKGGHAAAHGGAWKVAYADLVTAMMAHPPASVDELAREWVKRLEAE